MNDPADPLMTSPTLLGRLSGEIESQAWEQFVRCYAPAVYGWAWQLGLQESDAADVTQEVLLKLLDKIPAFRYEPDRGSFRGWLKTVTINAARDWGRRRARLPAGPQGLSGVGDVRQWDALGDAIELEYQRELLLQAESIVQSKVQTKTWNVYLRLIRAGESAATVSQALAMTVSEVYVAKSRLLKRLRDVIADLEQINGQVAAGGES